MSPTNLRTTNENDVDIEQDHLSSRPSDNSATTFTGQSRKMGKMEIRVSSLPIGLRQSVATLKLDLDGDGALDEEEIVMAVSNLATTTKDNKGLKKLVWTLCVFSVLLIACVFGASIAAARLAKDTEVDPSNGIMYAKGGNHEVLKTEDVIIYSNTTNIADMSNAELNLLKVILLSGGDVKFQIKGYARSVSMDTDTDTNDDQQVKLLVEGGTITYDNAGIASATGDAQELLEFAYGVNTNTTDRRFLQTQSSSESSSETETGSGAGGNTWCCNKNLVCVLCV